MSGHTTMDVRLGDVIIAEVFDGRVVCLYFHTIFYCISIILCHGGTSIL